MDVVYLAYALTAKLTVLLTTIQPIHEDQTNHWQAQTRYLEVKITWCALYSIKGTKTAIWKKSLSSIFYSYRI